MAQAQDTHKCVGKRLIEGLSRQKNEYLRPFLLLVCNFIAGDVTFPSGLNVAEPSVVAAVLSRFFELQDPET